MERYCYNVICAAPTTSKVKGLRWDYDKWKAKGTALSQQMATRLSVLNNWRVNQRQTGSGRTMTIRINYNRSTVLERSVINHWGGGFNLFYAAATSLLWFIYKYKLFGPREGPLLTKVLINESKQWTYKSRFFTEMKQDEYSKANQLWNAGATEVQQLNPGDWVNHQACSLSHVC